jgi:hypothetical protein
MQLDEELTCDARVDGMAGEITVFGRHLRSADSSVHAIVRMRLKQLRPTAGEGDADWTAVAALSLAYATGVPQTARLRVSEFSLADGEYRTVFDGTRADATALHERRGRPLRDALSPGPFSPGAGCAECAFVNVCPAVPKRRGVLGIPGMAVATRYLTAADLPAYERCPTAFLARRRDHLPDAYLDDADRAPSEAGRERGLAVHAWLRWAHSRVPARECRATDLPEPDDTAAAQVVAAAGLDADQYRVAYPYLIQHLHYCPCGFDGLDGWAPERRVVRFDHDADMVAVSTPDLACAVSGAGNPIWRETKTSTSIPTDLEDALRRYPAFALNIAMLAAEVPAPREEAHAELEVLTADAGHVFHVSTSDGATVAAAQKLVADIARRYAADLVFDRKPSGACLFCPAYGWCDPPLTPAEAAANASATDGDEFADFEAPF